MEPKAKQPSEGEVDPTIKSPEETPSKEKVLLLKCKTELAEKEKQLQIKLQSFNSLKVVNDALQTQLNEAKKNIATQESTRTVLDRKNKTLENRISQLTKQLDKSGKQMLSQREISDTLRLKDEKIAGILREGEALSLKQMKMETTIKKLKISNKENDENLTASKAKVERLQKEIELRNEKLKKLEESKSSNSEAYNKLKALQEENSKNILELQNKVREKDGEIRILKGSNEKLKSSLESMGSENALSLVKEKQKLEYKMNQTTKKEAESLRNQVADYERMLVERERQNADLQDQISKLNSEKDHIEQNFNSQMVKLQTEFDASGTVLSSESVQLVEATRPLIFEIESLTNSYEEKVRENEEYEKVIEELRHKHGEEVKELRDQNFKYIQDLEDIRKRAADLGKENSSVRMENDTHASMNETLKSRISYLEGTVEKIKGDIEESRSEFSKAESVLKAQLLDQINLNNSLAKQSERHEEEKDKLVKRNSQQEKELTDLRDKIRKNRDRIINPMAKSDSEASFGTGTLWKSLNDIVGSKDSVSNSYRAEMNELANTNAELTEKMSLLGLELEKAKKEMAVIPDLREQVETLEKRYELALEMVGEREERYEEVNEDIVDIKRLYKNQVMELLARIEELEQELKAKG